MDATVAYIRELHDIIEQCEHIKKTGDFQTKRQLLNCMKNKISVIENILDIAERQKEQL
jgi:hypothetical protein